MDKLLKDIKDYILYLEEEKNLDVCLCDINSKLFPFIAELSPHNSHKNFFCTFLKKNPHLQKECIVNQLKVRAALEKREYFFGRCYAGVNEYVFKITHGKEWLGFISLSSYCKSREKSYAALGALCEKHGFEKKELCRIFDTTVKAKIPPLEEIKPLALALSRQIELLYLLINNPVREAKSENIVFSRILAYLTENYTKNIQIKDVAEATHYSPSYISHIFTSVKKSSIMFYVNDLRVQKSKELLEKTDFPVTEIAYLVGFNDSNYFTSIFKKYTSVTPTKYRRLVKKSSKGDS
ncbi:MAG: helix-turn-helix domain-containing protein [Clostridia bacterium]|nr:helix-turn-helix domain-containing protein [Clostridia bacterium]